MLWKKCNLCLSSLTYTYVVIFFQGRLGLPKFWESVGRGSGRPGLSNKIQAHVIKRIKYMVGYPETTRALVEADGDGIVLTEVDKYSMGTVRPASDYLELTMIDPVEKKCPARMPWCGKGELELKQDIHQAEVDQQ